jgi:glycosyltransferase involved in cell wall biosynthesis
MNPLVSVVIEGYNESLSLGSVDATLEGLRRQDFPLDAIEVILVGSAEQAEAWARTYADPAPFHTVKTLSCPGAHYYELKNQGAALAAGEIIALTDSDVCPEPQWISALVASLRSGAEITAGVTLFHGENGAEPRSAAMLAAASISWGFVVPRPHGRSSAARAFLSHNLGVRAELFRKHQYRTDLGRTCAGSFLFDALTHSGTPVAFAPRQRVAHTFSWRWWMLRLHRRFGYEVLLMRQLKTERAAWLRAVAVIEPAATTAWHVMLDIPHWLNFSAALGLPAWRRMSILPLVLALSVVARTSEMVGMYQTLAAPEAMKRFAESN